MFQTSDILPLNYSMFQNYYRIDTQCQECDTSAHFLLPLFAIGLIIFLAFLFFNGYDGIIAFSNVQGGGVLVMPYIHKSHIEDIIYQFSYHNKPTLLRTYDMRILSTKPVWSLFLLFFFWRRWSSNLFRFHPSQHESLGSIRIFFNFLQITALYPTYNVCPYQENNIAARVALISYHPYSWIHFGPKKDGINPYTNSFILFPKE